MQEVFDAGEIKREDVFVTSKLWNSEHDPAHVKASAGSVVVETKVVGLADSNAASGVAAAIQSKTDSGDLVGRAVATAGRAHH